MPISTSSFGDDRDNRYGEYERADNFEQETMEFPGLTPEQAEATLKRLGGGVAEKLQKVEGIGWQAVIIPSDAGVEIEFSAHGELLDDLLRRFEELVSRL
jgi:hypothetical protein